MFKVYKKADILEKISDRVKMVDDLYHLPPDLFDRELFDYWYSVYLDDYQDRGYDDFDFDLRDGNNGLHAGTWVNVPCIGSTAITPITYKHARNGAERR